MALVFTGADLSSNPEDAVDPRSKAFAVNKSVPDSVFTTEDLKPVSEPAPATPTSPVSAFSLQDITAPAPVPTTTPAADIMTPKLPGRPTEATGQNPLTKFGSQFASRVGEMGAGVAALPAGIISMLMAGRKSADESNPAVAMGRNLESELTKGYEKTMTGLETKPGETLVRGVGTTVGGPAFGELLATGDTTKIKENPGGALADLIFNASVTKQPIQGGLASLLIKARPIIEGTAVVGKPIIKASDYLGTKFIAKYNFTPEFLGLEAATEGTKFYKTSTVTNPTTVDAAKLIAANPKTAPFLTPDLNVSTPNVALLNRAYNRFHAKQQAEILAGKRTAYTDMPFNRHDLDVIVDKDGFARYAKANEFNALSADEQKRIFNARTTADTNHELLHDAKMITDEEYQAGSLGYAHKTYRIFHNEADWIHELKTNPNTAPILDDVRADLRKKGIRDPFDQTQPATPEQVDNQIWSILGQAGALKSNPQLATVSGPLQSATSALIKRKNLPASFQKLLGAMDNEYAAVRLGQTLDMQQRALIWNNMAETMSTMKAFDGRPLLVKPGAPGVTVAPAGMDYVALAADSPHQNPIWGRKWSDAQIHPDVIDAIRTVGNPPLTGIIAKALQVWKTSKVAMNFPTHINNFVGDVLFTHYAGASAMNPVNGPHFLAAGNDLYDFMASGMSKTSPMLGRAMQSGGVRPGLASIEMGSDYANAIRPGVARTWEDRVDRVLNSSGPRTISTVYDMEDQVMRYGVWRKLVAEGKTDMEASIEVNKYFPSYTTTSPVGNWLRGHGPLEIGKQSLPAWTGAVLGGPFTSFPIEVTRIHMTVAKEHPWRFATANMIPLSIATLGMGASGMTINDYHEMLAKQPPYMRGRLMIPVPTPGGKPALLDWTQMFPQADWNMRKEFAGYKVPGPFPQGLFVNGIGWSLLDAMRNLDSNGQPIANHAKGEGTTKWMSWLASQILPTSSVEMGNRLAAGIKGLPYTKSESEPQSLLRAPFQTLTPQIGNYKYLEDLNRAGMATRRGQLGEVKAGFRNIGKDRTLSGEEKTSRRENLREERKSIKEGNQ